MKLVITPLDGIGDQIYTRPIIKRLVEDGHQVWLKCGLPDLFSDLKVKFCEFTVNSRTQLKVESKVKFVKEPAEPDQVIAPRYNLLEFMQHGVTGALEFGCGYEPKSQELMWDLPSNLLYNGPKLPNQPIAVIKGNTLRSEWVIPARNCSTKHLAEVTAMLQQRGYYVISIADIEPPLERWDGPEPDGDMKLHHGETGIMGMLALFKRADLVVGGPSVVIPATIAAGSNLLIMWGGRGYYDCPELLLDERMDHSKIAHVMPDRFCKCRKRLHECDKTVTNLEEQLDAALTQFARSPADK